MKLAGRSIMITGAARGIGKALAGELHRRGAKVMLTGLEPDALRAAAHELGAGAHAFDLDVSDLSAVEAAVAHTTETFGHLDVVVANAGITQVVGAVETLEPERFERVIDVNLLGTYRTMRASARHLAHTRGYFLSVCSTAYGFNAPLQAHYAASKAGVHALTNSFRLEMRWAGVGVGALYPNFVAKGDDQTSPDTPLGKALWNETGEGRGVGKVTLERVVNAAVRAITGRKRAVVVPRRFTPVVLAPWLMQPLVERNFSDGRLEYLVKESRKTLRQAQTSRAE